MVKSPKAEATAAEASDIRARAEKAEMVFDKYAQAALIGLLAGRSAHMLEGGKRMMADEALDIADQMMQKRRVFVAKWRKS